MSNHKPYIKAGAIRKHWTDRGLSETTESLLTGAFYKYVSSKSLDSILDTYTGPACFVTTLNHANGAAFKRYLEHHCDIYPRQADALIRECRRKLNIQNNEVVANDDISEAIFHAIKDKMTSKKKIRHISLEIGLSPYTLANLFDIVGYRLNANNSNIETKLETINQLRHQYENLLHEIYVEEATNLANQHDDINSADICYTDVNSTKTGSDELDEEKEISETMINIQSNKSVTVPAPTNTESDTLDIPEELSEQLKPIESDGAAKSSGADKIVSRTAQISSGVETKYAVNGDLGEEKIDNPREILERQLQDNNVEFEKLRAKLEAGTSAMKHIFMTQQTLFQTHDDVQSYSFSQYAYKLGEEFADFVLESILHCLPIQQRDCILEQQMIQARRDSQRLTNSLKTFVRNSCRKATRLRQNPSSPLDFLGHLHANKTTDSEIKYCLHSLMQLKLSPTISEVVGRPVDNRATPDILFRRPLKVYGHEINWIDAKKGWVIPGLSAAHRIESFMQQMCKYVDVYGAGAVFWEFSFTASMENLIPGVIHFRPTTSVHNLRNFIKASS